MSIRHKQNNWLLLFAMKLKDLAQQFNSSLINIYEEEESHAIFLIVVAQLLNYNRANYLIKKEEPVNPEIQAAFEAIAIKLQAGVPIQYILGETLFYGLPFKVSPAVLIPRPETEELVDWIIEKTQPITLLDIGTGSGCIAIALKKHLQDVKISALDISGDALAIAKQNAVINKVDINFIQADALQLTEKLLPATYSVIVSNPPYITGAEKATMHQNVLANEPHLALFVPDEHALVFYEAIANYALSNLENKGLLFFEINEHLGKETVAMLNAKGFKNIVLKKDMQGKDRMICCEKIKIVDGIA